MKKKTTLFDVINNILLILVAIVCIYPFWYILSLSLSDGQAIANGSVNFFPVNVHLEAYKYILQNKNLAIFSGLKNSAIYTILGTAAAVFTTYMTAYVLTRRKFKGRFLLMGLFVFTWVFEAGIIPSYIVYSAMGMVNNPLVMIVPSAINVQYLIITKSFLDNMPYELEEAAYIDGANDIQIMLRIYLPVSSAILATVAVFYAVFIWNQYLTPLLYLQNPDLFTIQQILKRLVISSGDSNTSFRTIIQNGHLINPSNLRSAAIFVAMLPIVLIYPFVQKYFKNGVLIGSVKG